MKSRKNLFILLTALLLMNLACSLFDKINNIPNRSTATVLSVVTLFPTQSTPSFQETKKRQHTPTSTSTITPTPTSTPNYRATESAATQTAAISQTEQARPMAEQIQELIQAGYLPDIQGLRYQINNFDETWNDPNDYRWWNSGYQPTDFVVKAKAEWWSATEIPDRYNSGCGFVFRALDHNNHFRILLTLDGRVRFDRLVNGQWLDPRLSPTTPMDGLQGSKEIMWIVMDERLIFFLDAVKVYEVTDDLLGSPKFKGGDLALTMLSGTEAGYGTRCKLTDIELWIIQ